MLHSATWKRIRPLAPRYHGRNSPCPAYHHDSWNHHPCRSAGFAYPGHHAYRRQRPGKAVPKTLQKWPEKNISYKHHTLFGCVNAMADISHDSSPHSRPGKRAPEESRIRDVTRDVLSKTSMHSLRSSKSRFLRDHGPRRHQLASVVFWPNDNENRGHRRPRSDLVP